MDEPSGSAESGPSPSVAGVDLATLDEALPVALFVVGLPHRRIEHVNRAVRDVLGYSPGEAVGQLTRMFYPDEEGFRSFGEQLQAAAAAGLTHLTSECALRHKDGHTLWASIDTTLVRAEGRLCRVVSVVRDHTAIREAQQALQAEKERAQSYLDVAGAMILALDASARVTLVNRRGAEVLGLPKEQILGREWMEFLPGEQRAAARQAYRRVMEGAGVERLHEGVVLGAAGPRTLSWSSVVLTDEAGRPAGMLSSAEDVTEKRRVEAELARSEQARREAETMAALGSLVGDMAHEVRNPLFAISATLEALELGPPLPEPRATLLAALRQETERLAGLVQDLLEYGKPQPLGGREQDLRQVVLRAVRNRQDLASERAVSITTGFDPALGEVPIDGRFLQALENLLDNAVRHSPAGGVVQVEAGREADGDHPGARCSVLDQGAGFEERDLVRVFQPFYSRRPGGTGLGLAIVSRIVQQHGGTVRAENRPGGGAAVHIWLPA